MTQLLKKRKYFSHLLTASSSPTAASRLQAQIPAIHQTSDRSLSVIPLRTRYQTKLSELKKQTPEFRGRHPLQAYLVQTMAHTAKLWREFRRRINDCMEKFFCHLQETPLVLFKAFCRLQPETDP